MNVQALVPLVGNLSLGDASHLVECDEAVAFHVQCNKYEYALIVYVRTVRASSIQTNLSNCVSGRIEVCHFLTPAPGIVCESGANRLFGGMLCLATAARVLQHKRSRLNE